MNSGVVDVFSIPARKSVVYSTSINRARLFMEQHFVEHLSLSQLATIANLTLFRFATVFRKEVGIPPYRYLSHLRVAHAKSLLSQGVPAAVVAAETGFFDQSHMVRHFKRICGVTPSQYMAASLVGPGRAQASTVSANRAEAC